MAVHVFYNPDLVGQLASCGITARRRTTAGAPAAGFVMEGRRVAPSAREAITNVIAVRGPVTITGPRLLTDRQLLTDGRPPVFPATTTPTPQTALELVEECARLRRDNQRLSGEVTQLRAEIDRLTAAPGRPRDQREPIDLDDAAKRFSLLELDL